jgi:protein TonB
MDYLPPALPADVPSQPPLPAQEFDEKMAEAVTAPAPATKPAPPVEPRRAVTASEPRVRTEPAVAPVPVRLMPKSQQPANARGTLAAKPATVKEQVQAPQPPSSFMGNAKAPAGAPLAMAGSISSPAPPPPPERIRVGGLVIAAKLIHETKPKYPLLAQKARIQGTVRLEAVISKEGAVKNLGVISGHELLAPAALEAVRQWRYQPTLQNGVPVEVISTVDVNFRLDQQ